MFPDLGTKQDCDKTHVYQTFIAGRMSYDLRRQSQLDSDAHIRRVCTNEMANSMLRSGDRRSDWEIRYLGPAAAERVLLPLHHRPRRAVGATRVSRSGLTAAGCSMPVSSRSSMRSKSQPAGSSNPPASQIAAVLG